MVVLILLGLGVIAWLAYLGIRYYLKERYFASEEFLGHKAQLASFVAEHNEVGQYTSEIAARGLFQLGAASTGTHAHLASFQNTSQWNYRRDRNVANYQPNVHNCSLQVVRNASADPLKYVMKYFHIKADEPTLSEVETLSESIVRLEDAIANLRNRESSITQAISPPKFILKHYKGEFMQHVGVELRRSTFRTRCTYSST